MIETEELLRHVANRPQLDRVIGQLEKLQRTLDSCLYAVVALLFIVAAAFGKFVWPVLF